MNESIVAAALLLTVACATARSETLDEPRQTLQAVGAYRPGLGDIMGPIQMRHAKLWFAGTNENWPLAGYELDELKEGFVDAARLQPEFKGRPIAKMIERFISAKLVVVQEAVDAANRQRFKLAFDELTTACNACHEAAGFGFISIQRPTELQYSNQSFERR